MRKNKLSVFLLSFVLVLMLISCSNNTSGASAKGLLVGRVGTVFADPNYKYDVAYKNGSTRYIAYVTVSLSNGTYTDPSSVKGELLKLDGSNWISVRKNITGQIEFSESGTYKVRYTSDGFTADTEEFQVYKPGELYNFSATQPVYAEGAQSEEKDFTYTYCYKDENGSIGLTNSLPQDEVLFYTLIRDENETFFTLLDDQGTYKSSANKVYAGIVIPSPDTPEGYINEEIEIKVLKNCETDIKSYAKYKLKKGTANEYEFSGNIYKRFIYNEEVIGRTVILSKTDDGVKIAEGFSIETYDLLPDERTLTSVNWNEEYDKVKEIEWTPANENTFGPKVLSGPGYILLRITENGEEITKDNPGYIRVRK